MQTTARTSGRAAALVAAVWVLALAASAAGAASNYRVAVEKRFTAWVQDLGTEALAAGITKDAFDSAMKGVKLDWALPDLELPNLGPDGPAAPKAAKKGKQRQQPEFDRPSSYFPSKSLNWVVKTGRQKLAAYGKTLAAVEEKYGVQKSVVLAVWGRETAFGRAKIPHYAVRALATQAFMGRRKDFFRAELLLAFKILQEGHVTRQRMRSSWAGAMGHTQFLPSDFEEHAVDFNGDGKRDIWGTIPDALASTANYLSKNGWEMGKTWGYEVVLPKRFDCTLEDPDQQRPIGDWVKLGLKRTRGRKFREDRLQEPAHLVLPAGTKGPAFLALKNFAVIKTYNKADLYALYVGHVADRFGANRAFAGRWAKVSRFRRNEIKAIQQAIADAGIEVGKIDGLAGAKTRAAIGRYQRKLRLPVDCYPSRTLLKKVREGS
ncbi:MAG: lytic murein transglycosylase [Methyloligellaceae bacterium]